MSFLVALALASAQPQLAKAGDCGWVHGRYVEAMGSRIHRIFVLGTGHALNVDIPDEGDGSIPTTLRRYFETGQFQPLKGQQILGDFYVCARERRVAGAMQRVDLNGVKKIRITTY
jgi:hypothetical protein